ncbi:MAG TPA: T9SS type A sorting domain-containing protein, partial [Ignavibacteriaceae bacterium]
DLPEQGNVELKLFNTLGEEVMVILNEQLQAGTHRVNLNAGSLPSGVYVYKLITNSLQFSNKMILLK